MRLRVISDLHLEFGPFEPPPCAADVVVLAGDIHTGTQAVPWVQQHFPAMPVVLVLGNHEFYGHAAPALVEDFRAAVTGTNVHLLENAAVDLKRRERRGTPMRRRRRRRIEPNPSPAPAR